MIGNFLSSKIGTVGPTEELSYYLTRLGYKTIVTSSQIRQSYRLIDMLITTGKHAKQIDVAVIDTYNYRAFLWAELTCQLLQWFKKPYILVLHAGLMPEFEREQPDRVKRLLSSATLVVTPSKYLKESLMHVRSDIIHLPNPIDVSAYSFQLRTNPSPHFVWLRAFEDLYQPQVAIKAFYLVQQRYEDAKLILYGRDTGDGTLEACKALIEQFGLEDAVTIHAQIQKKDVPKHLKSHDFFLNTTRAESFGVAVMEAAALGQCIITTNVGELPYIWNHEVDAMLVSPDDPEHMASAILQVLETPSFAQQLSINARKKAEAYDWNIILPQWIDIIEQAISLHNIRR